MTAAIDRSPTAPTRAAPRPRRRGRSADRDGARGHARHARPRRRRDRRDVRRGRGGDRRAAGSISPSPTSISAPTRSIRSPTVLAAGVPLIFATGSHRDCCRARFADCPVLEKPYALAAVEAALGQTCRSSPLVLIEQRWYDASPRTRESDDGGGVESGGRRHGQGQGARSGAGTDRPRLRQGLGDEARQPRDDGDRKQPDRIARPRHRARHRRPAARPRHRDLRPGKLGQDDARAACHRRGAEERRHRRLRRRRARARPGLCQEARRQHRRTDRVAARHRRAGARDRRHARPLERDRRAGRSTRSPRSCRAPRSRARWATAMSACRRG